MLLGIVEDFTSSKTLDAQLLAASDSGLSINSGVHPSITIDNLLHFLPDETQEFSSWVTGTTYGKYATTRLKGDIVLHGGQIYESIADANQGNTPALVSAFWLLTNIESIRLKTFIHSVEQKVLADINLVRRQVDSQYLYNLVEQNRNITPTLLANDFAGYKFEAKGSDYTHFTINQAALQATTDTPQNLYVINQGVLITTLTLNPNLEGRLVFKDLNYSFSGKGQWFFVIDSQNVLRDGGFVDPLKFDGFVPETINGIGTTPEDAVYSFGQGGNGLSFNITAHFDPAVYVEDNLKNFGQYYQATFELQALRMFFANSNNRSNLQERTQFVKEDLKIEIMSLEHNTSATRHARARKEAISMLEKTFDREIGGDNDAVEITIGSV